MTLEEFGALIAALNVPAIYGPYQNAQATPYISYSAIEKNVIYADGRVIYGEDWIELRLVTGSRDLTLERMIEQLLTDNGISFDYPDFEFDESQRIHTAYYNFMLCNVPAAPQPIKYSVYVGTDGKTYVGTDGKVYANRIIE